MLFATKFGGFKERKNKQTNNWREKRKTKKMLMCCEWKTIFINLKYLDEQ